VKKELALLLSLLAFVFIIAAIYFLYNFKSSADITIPSSPKHFTLSGFLKDTWDCKPLANVKIDFSCQNCDWSTSSTTDSEGNFSVNLYEVPNNQYFYNIVSVTDYKDLKNSFTYSATAKDKLIIALSRSNSVLKGNLIVIVINDETKNPMVTGDVYLGGLVDPKNKTTDLSCESRMSNQASGVYNFQNVPLGKAVISAMEEGTGYTAPDQEIIINENTSINIAVKKPVVVVTTGLIKGSVFNGKKAKVGAEVTLKKANTSKTLKTIKTDKKGKFTFSDLQSGSYKVTSSYKSSLGKNYKKSKIIKVRANNTKTIKLVF